MTTQEVTLSEQQIREQQETLARRRGFTAREAYIRMDRGEFRGTIFESELSMLRFLLGEDAPLPAAAE